MKQEYFYPIGVYLGSLVFLLFGSYELSGTVVAWLYGGISVLSLALAIASLYCLAIGIGGLHLLFETYSLWTQKREYCSILIIAAALVAVILAWSSIRMKVNYYRAVQYRHVDPG